MKFIKKRILYKSSVLEDIVVGIAILLAGYFYYYENKTLIANIANPGNINYAIKIGLGAIIIITWLILSFQNGVKKRQSFLIASMCLWIIPQVVKYILDMVDVGIYSTALQRSFTIFFKYLANINYLSLRTFGDMVYDSTGIPYYITLNVAVLLFEGAFVAGFLCADYFRDKKDRKSESVAPIAH